MHHTNRKNRLEILICARSLNYKLRRINAFNYVLDRTTEKHGSEVVNVYWNSKNSLFTVLTALNHPSKGKTQMTRKFLSVETVLKILKKPRLHTDRGYRKK